ncbi:MAG: CRISPR-associated protein Csx16 [Methylotenera sp.]|uniref:CRISPR-associated protein Csx16 n=1 Tax=Methylotenera sp. TaxID=2051956 RepID=UPI000D451FE3|nr:CRISPR-associated protein Csx16 [Methylotenera sp.]PPC83993.1 MAG: CRISPR-associated protein Csx16 [Methylotenera sp.]
MKTYLITRHPGAVAWFQQQGIQIDQHLPHLNAAQIAPQDKVYGSLPIHLAAQICAIGAEYWHLSLDMPPQLRGQELSATQLNTINARLERFVVTSP